jgi:hypothetical protein
MLRSQVPPHPTQNFSFDLSGVREAETNGVRVVRIFVELYIDAFGAFQKKYYSPEGIYVTLGNLPRTERNQLDNIWCVGMKPPDTDEAECLEFFVQDVKKLQRGFYVQLQDERIFVIGGLGIVKAGQSLTNLCHWIFPRRTAVCLSSSCTTTLACVCSVLACHVLTAPPHYSALRVFTARHAPSSIDGWLQKPQCK